MPWNEPGNNNDNRGQDPWGNRGDGPPDLDEALKNFQRKLNGIFGGGQGGSVNVPGSSGSGFLGTGLILIIGLIIWGLSGFFVIEPAEEAVITRFGQYSRTEGNGLMWIPRFIDKVDIVNVEEIFTTEHGGEMLTMDENIVSAKIALQYKVNNARDFLFNIKEPKVSLQKVTESALRSVVGEASLSEVLTTGRAEISGKIRKQVQTILDNYKSGLYVSDLAMQQTKAPEAVKEAFDDAIKAQQDEERFVNQAEAYSNKQIPIAEGHAKRILEEALGYKEQVILRAQGETERFTKLLPEYKRDPKVMRDRLFLETMQEVYSKTNKIMVDVDGGNSVMYLPLDRMINNSTRERAQNQLTERLSEMADLSPSKVQSVASNRQRPKGRVTYDDIQRYRRGGA